MTQRPLVYNAFLTNSLSHIHHGLWRDPSSKNLDFNSLDTWIDLARRLDLGGFDSMFFADTLGPFDTHTGGWRTSVEHTLQFPSGDPIVLIPALAAATERLGFVVTSSILREHPFPFARTASTLDHLTGGRFGWNVVTSSRRTEARALGLDDIPSHEIRYGWAEEYLEIVYRLWEGSWDDDAIVWPESGDRFLDPSRIHEVRFEGERFRTQGVHQQTPSPQRTPVIFQAGGSPLGRRFAARHAEGTFIAGHDPASARAVIDEIRGHAQRSGRGADDVHFIQGIIFVVGSTEEEARRLSDEVDLRLDDTGMLAHMSGTVGVDFGSLDLDRPLEDFRTEQTWGVVRGLIESAPEKPKTLRELTRWAWSQRIVGTPEQIADEVQRWADAGVTGFNVIHITTPGSYVDFIEQVAPVLQRRGLMRRPSEHPGGQTLRERLFHGRGPAPAPGHPARRFHRDPASAPTEGAS